MERKIAMKCWAHGLMCLINTSTTLHHTVEQVATTPNTCCNSALGLGSAGLRNSQSTFKIQIITHWTLRRLSCSADSKAHNLKAAALCLCQPLLLITHLVVMNFLQDVQDPKMSHSIQHYIKTRMWVLCILLTWPWLRHFSSLRLGPVSGVPFHLGSMSDLTYLRGQVNMSFFNQFLTKLTWPSLGIKDVKDGYWRGGPLNSWTGE